MWLRRAPLHSFLFSLYPVAYLYAGNIMFVRLEDTLRPLAVSFGLAVFFLISFRIIVKSWRRAGVLCTVLIAMFFSFGHLANLLPLLRPALKGGLPNITAIAWSWLAIFLILTFIVIQARLPVGISLFLNVAAVVLLAFPLATITSTLLANSSLSRQSEKTRLSEIRQEDLAEASLRKLSPGELPDIYYIIFDSYERADVLETLYGFDNSAFIQELKRRGFYVASSSRSNYLNTTYSLNTALNLVYYNDFPRGLLMNARYNLQTNYVSEFLREQGYQIVVFDSGTGDSNDQYADVFVSPAHQKTGSTPAINAFETLLIRTTMGILLFKGGSNADSTSRGGPVLAETVNRELDVRRQRIIHTFAHLPDFASSKQPHFIFAHIYLPHYPFLFGPGGEELKYHENMNLYWYEPEPANHIEQYIDQVKYLNQAVLPAIDKILANSTKPAVIILQSDHGDSRFIDWNAPTTQGIHARSATLNAVYFPDQDYDTLYPTMTTVNTFRLVFNHWFGTTYPLLPDRVYFHKHSAATSPGDIPQFIDACGQFNLCLPDLSGAIRSDR